MRAKFFTRLHKWIETLRMRKQSVNQATAGVRFFIRKVLSAADQERAMELMGYRTKPRHYQAIQSAYHVIRSAADKAVAWLNRTIPALARYLGKYPISINEEEFLPLRIAMFRHFHSDVDTVTAKVIQTLGDIRKIIQPWSTAPQPNPNWFVSAACYGGRDSDCKGVAAYAEVGGKKVVFCLKYFRSSAEAQAETLIHEIAHTLGRVPGRRDEYIRDVSYIHERYYRRAGLSDAIQNADSYSNLTWELGAEKKRESPQREIFEDCPANWKTLIQDAIAQAELWNRSAFNASNNNSKEWMTNPVWRALRQNHLQTISDSSLEQAKMAYKKVDSRLSSLRSGIHFECEPTGGRGGKGVHFYFYRPKGLSDLHVNPSWVKLADANTRGFELLYVLYKYLGDIDDATQRSRYAHLAQQLHSKCGRVSAGSMPTCKP